MTVHPDPSLWQAQAAGRLSPRETLRLDAHLAACEQCRQASSRQPDGQPAQAVLQAVVDRGTHLSFEQLQAYVDAGQPADRHPSVAAHTALCGMCRRELDDLARQAPILQQPVARRPTPARPSLWQRWLQGPAGLSALSLAGVAGLALVALLMQPPGSTGPGGPADLASSARQGPALQLAALDRLETLSPELAQAWQQRRYAVLLPRLRTLAAQRNPVALAALGSLHAQGLGVPQDMQAAQQYWQRAADLGDTLARENLAAIGRVSTEPGPRAP